MKIPLRDIDMTDRFFKISRDRIDDSLRSSIRAFGVLEPPAVESIPGGYRVISGFNRLSVLLEMGCDEVEAVILTDPGVDFFIRQAVLKSLRNEIGPMGRLKALDILHEFFRIDPERLERCARAGLQVPGDFLGGGPLAAAVRGLPDPLKAYLDFRDIPFKIIRELAGLPRGSIERISLWVAHAPLRVNIFKGIVEMLSDIGERDGSDGAVGDVAIDEADDRKKWEERLFAQVYRARYPGYAALKKKADAIVENISRSGVRVEYPAYFEGDGISVTVNIRKRDDADSVLRNVASLDPAMLKELLDLL